MRRSASEIIRNLERRIARLEKQSSISKKAMSNLPDRLLRDIASHIEGDFDIDDVNWRDITDEEQGVSKNHGFDYFMVSVFHEESEEEYYAIISLEYDDYQIDDTFDDSREAYRTWNRWTK